MKRENKFLCVLPWNHVYVSNDGHFHPCCMSKNPGTRLLDESGIPLNVLNDDSFKQVRFSQKIAGMKDKMLKGQVPSECRNCELLESSGRKSYRKHVNELFPETYDKILSTSSSDAVEIEFFDLRPGNLCNLKCRMCGPYSSSGLLDDFSKFFRGEFPVFSILDNKNFHYVLENASSIKRLNVAGGEPFIMKNVMSLIEKLSHHWNAKNIVLSFNSNMTVLDSDFIQCWKRFKKVEISASVDAYGELNRYIRYPSDWDVIIENIEACRQHAEVRINSTVQIYNIFDLDKLFSFFHEKGIPINPFILTDPIHLSIQSLPQELKKQAQEKIYHLVAKYPECPDLLPIINFMNSEDKNEFFPVFIKWTKFLDERRNESVKRYVPELEPYFS